MKGNFKFNNLVVKDKSFYKKAVAIALPIALQGLITQGVNAMDTVMVRMLGEPQLSAVSLANQFITIYHIFCMGIGMGASVLVARYYGMKDRSALKKTVSIMLRLCIGMALLFSLMTAICPELIMKMFIRDDAKIINYGIEYLKYSVPTYIFLGLSLTCTIVLRNVKQMHIPLYTSVGALFVNVGANYVFMFGLDFLKIPAFGVAGAAIGTLVARIFEFLVICGFLFFKDKEIGFRIKDLFKPVGELWKEYIRISIPVFISDGILAFGNTAVTMVIADMGGSFVAANAMTTIVQQLSSVFTSGFAQSGAIITGNTLGEGDRAKAQREGWAFLGVGFLFGAVAALIILIISPFMLWAFNPEPDTRVIASQLMISISIIVLFQATNSIMTKGVLRGGGDTKMLMLTDNIFLWVISIPLGIIAGPILNMPPFWVYFFLKSDQVVKAVWCVLRLNSGKWIKKIRSEQELTAKKVQK